MPFASKSHHEYWTADMRYLDHARLELTRRGQRLRHLDPGELFSGPFSPARSPAGRTRPPSSRFFPRRYMTLWLARGSRHRRRRGLLSQTGQAIYRALGIQQAGDRAAATLAILPRNAVECPEAGWPTILRQRAQNWSELVEAHDALARDYNPRSTAHRERADGQPLARGGARVGSQRYATATKISTVPSSRTRYTRKLDALATRGFAAGGSTPRKLSPAEKQPLARPGTLTWSTLGRRSPATRCGVHRTAPSFTVSAKRPCSRPRSWCTNRSFSIWARPSARTDGSRPSGWRITRLVRPNVRITSSKAVRLHGGDLETCVAEFSATAVPTIRLVILDEVSSDTGFCPLGIARRRPFLPGLQ